MIFIDNIDSYLTHYKRFTAQKEAIKQGYESLNSLKGDEREKEWQDLFLSETDLMENVGSNYLPTLEEWEEFDFDRYTSNEKAFEQFEELESRSAINVKELAQKHFDETLNKINNSPFYKHVVAGNLIPVETLKSNEQDCKNGDWSCFAWFVNDVDFANWLLKKIKSITNETLEAKTEVPQLQINFNSNILYTLFKDLLHTRAITWQGKTEKGAIIAIARMLEANFLNKDGKRLKISTILEHFKPDASKAKYRIDISSIPLHPKRETKKT